jgi:hypothetical protein
MHRELEILEIREAGRKWVTFYSMKKKEIQRKKKEIKERKKVEERW